MGFTNEWNHGNTRNPENPGNGVEWGAVFFFSPWKPKVFVKAIFGTFCHFFHGCKIIFTRAFLTFSSGFCTDMFNDFFMSMIFFPRAEKWKFSRVSFVFTNWNLELPPASIPLWLWKFFLIWGIFLGTQDRAGIDYILWLNKADGGEGAMP